MTNSSKKIAIIPARLNSTRLERKLLQDLDGKSVLQRTYESVLSSGLFDEVICATDSDEIVQHAHIFNASVQMTSLAHQSGTDRIAEVAQNFSENDIIINIQGDEPFISTEHLSKILSLFDSEIQIGSLCVKINSVEDLHHHAVVKVCRDKHGRAIYFSRHPIPFMRNIPSREWLQHGNYYRHIGIYGFKNKTLQELAKLEVSPLEKAESLEQLRWIENAYAINMAEVSSMSIGIDTELDLMNAREYLKKLKT